MTTMMMMQVWCIHIDQVSDKVLHAAIVDDKDLCPHAEKASSSALGSSSSSSLSEASRSSEEEEEEGIIVSNTIRGILQQPQDLATIRRFLFAEDRKRALLSILLQRCAIKNRCNAVSNEERLHMIIIIITLPSSS